MLSTAEAPTAGHVRDVILRTGQTLRLRPPRAADAEAALEFFRRLDDESRYMRFHGTVRVDERVLAGLLDPDWSVRGALIGVLRGPSGDEVVAVASYARLRDLRTAEAAFAVATGLQGQGVGTRLVEQLAQAAAAQGIETFVCEVMSGNEAMLGVFAETGFDVQRRIEGGEVHVHLRISPGERFLAAVDRRDHAAIDRSLQPFFHPRVVAVIGASARPGAIGGAIFQNIVAGGFTGRAVPVNRSGEPVAGVAAVKDIAEMVDPVDLAVVCVPAAAVRHQPPHTSATSSSAPAKRCGCDRRRRPMRRRRSSSSAGSTTRAGTCASTARCASMSGFWRACSTPTGACGAHSIGLLRGPGGDEVVAVASYARLRDPRTAEAAFAVATGLQGQGVGTRLVEQLAQAAAARASSRSSAR